VKTAYVQYAFTLSNPGGQSDAENGGQSEPECSGQSELENSAQSAAENGGQFRRILQIQSHAIKFVSGTPAENQRKYLNIGILKIQTRIHRDLPVGLVTQSCVNRTGLSDELMETERKYFDSIFRICVIAV
jgi:hypothetical protein